MKNEQFEFDINKFSAEYVDKNIERIYNFGHKFIKGAKNSIKAKMKRTYSNYIVSITKKYTKTKSFFIRDEQVFLETFYIPLSLSLNKKNVGKASIKELLKHGNYFVINGTAGCGKSILMKYLLLDTLRNTENVPIFIELRDMNRTDFTLYDLISKTLKNHKLNLDPEYFTKAFLEGQFIFFFDGYDEVDNAKRDIVRDNIFDVLQTYNKCKILISSRPDAEFSGWKDFIVFSVNNLEIDEACSLINKLPYDEDIKTMFTKDIRKELFKKHESFLSNPLLLSIMLLTYGQSANIPNKLSVFYNQAFEALFQRHDTYKAGFIRDRQLKIDIQDFAKVFSAFAVKTYDKREFQLSRIDALNYISLAKKITGIEFNSDHFLNDSLKSSCLLVEDGLFITFSHRSFQEYFTARFINDADISIKKALINKYSHNIRFDTVLKLLLEMNEDIMEKLFILPNFDLLFKRIGLKNKISIRNFYKYMSLCFSDISFRSNSIGCSHNDDNVSSFFTNFTSFVYGNCAHLIKWKTFGNSSKRQLLFKKYGNQKGENLYKFSSLTEYSEIIKDLYNSESYFSKRLIELLLNIYKAIKKRQSETSKSIEELLNN